MLPARPTRRHAPIHPQPTAHKSKLANQDAVLCTLFFVFVDVADVAKRLSISALPTPPLFLLLVQRTSSL